MLLRDRQERTQDILSYARNMRDFTAGISSLRYEAHSMKTTFQVKVGRRGTITIPKELRKRNTIEDGDLLTLTTFRNGVLVMSRLHSEVTKTANRLAGEWKQTGASLPIMLETLRRVRKENSQETL